MDKNDKQCIDFIVESGVLRKNYDAMFLEVMRRWDIVNSETEFKEMLQTLKVYCERKKHGTGTHGLATFLVATVKRNNNSLSIQNVAQLLEIVGIMFKGGGVVCKNIQSRFNDAALNRITRTVLSFENKMYILRNKKGASSAEELAAVEFVFNLNNTDSSHRA